MIRPVTTPLLLFVDRLDSSLLGYSPEWDREQLREVACRNARATLQWLRNEERDKRKNMLWCAKLQSDRMPMYVGRRRLALELIGILRAIILLDRLARLPDPVGRLADLVREDLSALPVLLDALEDAGMPEERRGLLALWGNGGVARGE